ncbi:glycosyltransferase [Halorubrum sp. N11]|uniref:glycosyltransferase n=1 Tax=Halorubrum sp. N11 TaxID=3402276 RepID=UPI003EBBAAE9
MINSVRWLESWPERNVVPRWLYVSVWALSIAVALSGIIGVGLGPNTRTVGYGLLAIGGGSLAMFSLSTEIRMTLMRDTGWLPFAVTAVGGFTFVAGVAFAADLFTTVVEIPLAIRLMVLATAFQGLLLTVDISSVRISLRVRATVLTLSHGAIFAGSLFMLLGDPIVPRAGLLLYAGGFASLLLHTFWARTHSPLTNIVDNKSDRQRWETLLLGGIVVGILGAISIVLSTPPGTLTLRSPLNRFLVTVTGTAAIVALATISAPQSSPSVLRWIAGPTMAVTLHVLVVFVIVNGLVLSVFVAVPWLFAPVFGGFITLLVVGVALNYAMLVNVWRRDREDPHTEPTPGLENTEVTVVVSALNDVDALSASLRDNVTALSPLPFLLVPAARATDGTTELMHAVQEDYPDRVRVAEATGGSKGADLNEVWDLVETPYALVLDADEAVGPSFVTQALRVLSDRPDVGIVQGRKCALYPDASLLSWFSSTERQHSTWLDQSFSDDILAAAHFAGSAAVIRQQVLPAVGGFNSKMLTEDIDLTTRLYLETDWDIAYVSEMVAKELLPGTWMALLQQRERWSRGWAQVATRRIGPVLRSWRSLGIRRTFGLSWLLFLAVSAPLFTVFPALALPTVALDTSLGISPAVAVGLAAFLLPERAISFMYTVFRDPEIQVSMTPRRIVATVIVAYLWIAFGWIVQFHSLYLHMSSAPQIWTVTRKEQPVVGSDTPDA